MVGHVILFEIEGDRETGIFSSGSHFDGIFNCKAAIMLRSCGALLRW